MVKTQVISFHLLTWNYLDWCSEVELHCHVTDDSPGGVELYKVQTLLTLVLIFLQTNLQVMKEMRNITHILHLQTFRLQT